MSDESGGPGWWMASDGKWYPPESRPGALPPPPSPSKVEPTAAETRLEDAKREANQSWMTTRHAGMLGWIWVCLAAIVVFVAVAALTESDEDPVAEPARIPAAAPDTPTCDEVWYFVDGSASTVGLTMERATGTEQITVGLPLRNDSGTLGLRAGCFGPFDFAYISAQNQGESGTVTCRIERNGVEVSTATSSGAYVIASCSD